MPLANRLDLLGAVGVRVHPADGHAQELRPALGAGHLRAPAGPVVRRSFLFVSRNRKRGKVLLWDGTGLCVYAKRLEQGSFTAVWALRGDEPARLTMSELQLFFDGTDLVGRWPLSPDACGPARLTIRDHCRRETARK